MRISDNEREKCIYEASSIMYVAQILESYETYPNHCQRERESN